MKLLSRVLLGLLVILLALGAILYRADIPVSTLKPTYAKPPSQFVSVDGMDVHYRIEGNPADSVPLVLIHGTSSSLFTWDGWVQALQADHRLVRLDLPNYALTGPQPQGNSSAGYYADFLARFLDKIGVSRCDVAGNSLGGNVAWHFAQRYPARVRKLILVDAAGYPFKSTSVPIGFKLARIPVLGNLLSHLTPKSLFRSSLENVYADKNKVTDALVQQFYDLNLRAGNRDALIHRTILPDSSWQQMRQIQQLTLILWGQKDGLIPPGIAQRFHRDLPHDTLIVYPNAGHVPMEELPTQTAADVRAFLGKK